MPPKNLGTKFFRTKFEKNKTNSLTRLRSTFWINLTLFETYSDCIFEIYSKISNIILMSFVSIFLDWSIFYFLICSFIVAKSPKKFCSQSVSAESFSDKQKNRRSNQEILSLEKIIVETRKWIDYLSPNNMTCVDGLCSKMINSLFLQEIFSSVSRC